MKILNDIGLTKSEALLYERLLMLGENPIGVLQKSLGVHPQIVYRAVEGLQKKGLVTVFNKKNKKYISPEHPRKLEEIEKEKLSKLKEALPELIHSMKPQKDVLVKTGVGYEAVRAFRRKAIDELKRNETLMIIGGAGKYYDVMGESNSDIEEKRIKKKINKKLIAFPSERERLTSDPYRLYTDFRYFSSSHPTTTSINIYGNHVGIIIWATEPILLHIKNEAVATSYRHYFNELWEAAKI